MENQPPRRRPPTPKLKFPLFGNSDGNSSDSGRNIEGDINPRHLMYLVGLMVLFMIGFEYYTSKKAGGVTKVTAAIEKVEWKGKVTKKYMGYDRPDIRMFDMKVDDQKAVKIDMSADSSQFFDILMPRDSVYKSKNSLKVRIKNYTRDTTILLQFAQ
ncbi:MAG: hypothetical protein V4683_17070 [Bacteroidota bacterium]